MRNKNLLILVVFVMLVFLSTAVFGAIERQKARAFVGQDLHLSGGEVLSYQPSPGEYTLVFSEGFSMSIGGNRFSSDKGVVLLESERIEFRGRVRIDYTAKVYLTGNIQVKKSKGAKTTDLVEAVVEDGKSFVVLFVVSGEVFVTAERRDVGDASELELYKNARAWFEMLRVGPRFVIQPEALIPEFPEEKEPVRKVWRRKKVVAEKPARAVEAAPEVKEKEPSFAYPVNIAPAGESQPKFESVPTGDQTDAATIIGRFYLWQRQEDGGLLELQADNAVIFYLKEQLKVIAEEGSGEDLLAQGPIRAIYLCGDVVMTSGQRTIRAEEIYYDFQRQKSVATDVVMRSFDVERGIPIYVRAGKLRQLAENQFAFENFTITTSEFYQPQISLTASEGVITDTTSTDARAGNLSDSSYDAEMRDVRLKMGETTIFGLPYMRSNLQRPDVPIKSATIGHDNVWGTSFETKWYLSRLLGLKEPKGTDGTLSLEYFSKRGFGSEVEIDYEKEDHYGRIIGYIIRDTGEDRLGRISSRRNLEPEHDYRGRLSWHHRHFLPYDWQVTTGVSYLSDERFLESFYRREYNTGLDQETYVDLKHIKDNQGLSILGKGRLNDFSDELEESPSVEYHLTGQSLFSDKFTLYSDSQVSRMRQRIGNAHTTPIDEQRFTFAWHRSELDMPVRSGAFKVVPYVAGNFGYDDRSGFRRTLVDGSNSGQFGDDDVLLGEAGIRAGTQFHKVYPNVKSAIWDLNKLRHIIRPQLTAAFYKESDSVIEQRDTLSVGISQRLQTKRGAADSERVVDWMRLDMDFTWVKNSDGDDTGPDRFIWNRPIVPLRVLAAPDIFHGDLRDFGRFHRFEMFGPRRNYFGADYIWRVSDTMAILSDINYDMQSAVVQQFNIGLSRMCWPNLSYYIGSRYLRRVAVLDEEGSNAFTFAATYILDPRYTLIFSQQFDFDYGASIRSDITLLRKYHRVYCGFTFSADESLDRQAIVFNIWPQGVPEMATGSRRYMGLGGAAGY